MTIGELKKDAKVKLAGVYPRLFGMSLAYLLLSFILTNVVNVIETSFQNQLVTLVVLLIFIAIDLLLVYGTTRITLKAVRNEDFKMLDFLLEAFKNVKKVWATSFKLFLKLFVPIFVFILTFTVFATGLLLYGIAALPDLFTISQDIDLTILPVPSISFIVVSGIIALAAGIYYIIVNLNYATYNLVLADNMDLPAKEILDNTKALMKGHKGFYFLIGLSFIHYFILIFLAYVFAFIFNPAASVIVAYALTALLTPYLTATQIVFYEELVENKAK